MHSFFIFVHDSPIALHVQPAVRLQTVGDKGLVAIARQAEPTAGSEPCTSGNEGALHVTPVSSAFDDRGEFVKWRPTGPQLRRTHMQF